jgi:CARDB
MARRLVTLLALTIVMSSPAAASAQPLGHYSGWFQVIWGDPVARPGRASVRYGLVDDRGQWNEVLVNELPPTDTPRLRELSRKRVAISGASVSERPAAIQARSIRLEPVDSRAAVRSPAVTGPQPWVTILCRFADFPEVTPRQREYFESLMGSSYPGMDHYWREVSYENISLTGSLVVGWYTLPQERAYYVYDRDGNGVEEVDFKRTAEDCTAAADSDVFLPAFTGINLMFNQPLDCCSWGGGAVLTRDGLTRLYHATWMPPEGFETQFLVAHEMGHGFGLPHSSGPYDATYDSDWDTMSGGGTCEALDVTDGCIGVHTISYHKDLLGWIPPERKYIPSSGGTETITMERLAQPAFEAGYLMAQVPIGGSTTQFYTVEARRFAGYDVSVPGEAIVIHKVDTNRVKPAQVVDVDGNGDPNDAGAMWTPGETFSDAANGISVSVDEATLTGFQITVSYNPPPFPASGRVTTTSGAPLAGVTLTFSRITGSGTVPAAIQTDVEGDWTLSAFEAGTTYRVTPTKAGFGFTPSTMDFGGASATLNFLGTGRPDLQGSWDGLSQRCRVVSGSRRCVLSGTVVVQNSGTVMASGSFVNFYLSADGQVDPTDVSLTRARVSFLAPGASRSIRLSSALPPGSSASGKFVIAVLDAKNGLPESDEGNNVIVFGPVP